MSPLWPDTVHVGLFPGASGLRTGRDKEIQPLLTGVHDPQALLRDLETMLDTGTAKLRKGSNVVVTVSDSVAAIVTMPWQPALSRASEMHSYARICFEKQGIAVDGNWTMHAEFRHYGAMGLAYAVPSAWLAELVELCEARGLKLKTVLPASARAYAFRIPRRQTGKTLVLLQETLRSSAMLLGHDGLHGYDAEPVIGTPQESGVRLLRRISVKHGEPGRVVHWAVDTVKEMPLPGFVTNCLPAVACLAMPQNIWGR